MSLTTYFLKTDLIYLLPNEEKQNVQYIQLHITLFKCDILITV